MEWKTGGTIKRLRKEKDVTQEDFAGLLGVSPQSVSRWENGVCYVKKGIKADPRWHEWVRKTQQI